jgi:hypothetical protein
MNLVAPEFFEPLMSPEEPSAQTLAEFVCLNASIFARSHIDWTYHPDRNFYLGSLRVQTALVNEFIYQAALRIGDYGQVCGHAAGLNQFPFAFDTRNFVDEHFERVMVSPIMRRCLSPSRDKAFDYWVFNLLTSFFC